MNKLQIKTDKDIWHMLNMFYVLPKKTTYPILSSDLTTLHKRPRPFPVIDCELGFNDNDELVLVELHNGRREFFCTRYNTNEWFVRLSYLYNYNNPGHSDNRCLVGPSLGRKVLHLENSFKY